jgi:glycolate oxidase iron-sulfur subunit
MLILDGCVQPSLAPNINTATARVLSALGISLVNIDKAGCCGAVSWHLSAPEEAKIFMRQNIDAWWPSIEEGVEAIVMTASGCGSVVKEYGAYLADDKKYAQKARRVSELTKDISEIHVSPSMRLVHCNTGRKLPV